MAIKEDIEKLKNLQTVLVEKYDLEKKIEKTPKELDSQNGLLARLKEEYIEKNKSYEESKAKVEEIKNELSDVVAKREASEKDMDSVTNHREYEALDKLIKEAKDKEDELRKELKSSEAVMEKLDEALKDDEALISDHEAQLNEAKESLEKEIDSYKSRLEELKTEEDEIVPELDQEIVYKFQRTIQRNSEGIVAVRNGVCTGCHMILPGQFANEVHEGENILFCPYCSRILYHEDVAAGEAENYSSLNETGSLADFDDDFGEELDEIGSQTDETDDGDTDGGSDSFDD